MSTKTLEEQLLAAAPPFPLHLPPCPKHPQVLDSNLFSFKGSSLYHCWPCLLEEIERIKTEASGNGYDEGYNDGRAGAQETYEPVLLTG